MASTLAAAAAAPGLLKKRLQFLHDAAHTLHASCPALARHYMSSFSALAARAALQDVEPLQISDKLVKTFCKACGSLFVPGQNCSVRVIPLPKPFPKAARRSKKRKRGQLEGSKEDGKPSSLDDQETPAVSTASAMEAKDMDSEKIPGPRLIRPRSIRIILEADRMAKSNSGEAPSSRKRKGAGSLDDVALNEVLYLCHICGSDTRMTGSRKSQLEGLDGRRLESAKANSVPRTKNPTPSKAPSTPTPSSTRGNPQPGTPHRASLTSKPPLVPGRAPAAQGGDRKRKEMQALLAKRTVAPSFSIDDFLKK
ncbi:hypothetical protein HDU67_000775 [Dinochytrium kinnereticum]|nr:hypothetical protein HDU67_000775 [Dinochytrium kinnereticum]